MISYRRLLELGANTRKVEFFMLRLLQESFFMTGIRVMHIYSSKLENNRNSFYNVLRALSYFLLTTYLNKQNHVIKIGDKSFLFVIHAAVMTYKHESFYVHIP